MESVDIMKYVNQMTEMIIDFAPKLAGAIAIWIIGFWLVKRISKLIDAGMQRGGLDPDIVSFLGSLINIALKMLVVLIAASLIGIEVTALVGILAAVGFAVGMALQGNLSNFAAGISIMILRPYRVGDWVEVSEKFGKVENIQIFYTTIVTPGHKTLIVPNGQIMENVITNFSAKGHIWLELNVHMPYSESYPKVRQVILDALATMPKVLETPAPQIGIEQYDSHFITLGVRPFIHPDDYWDVTFEAYERIKNAFSANNIQMAYSEGVEMGTIGK